MVNDSMKDGNGFKLNLPVKQKRALLASNPPRDSRPELIVDDEPGTIFPACPRPWQRPYREAGRAPGVSAGITHRTDRFRHAWKTHSEDSRVVHATTDSTELASKERSNSIGGR